MTTSIAPPASDASLIGPARVALYAKTRVTRLLPFLAATLTLLAAVLAIEPLPVGVFYDDAQYVILAKALATGQGYRFLNLPGAPLATHFPPGYPAFLALLWRLWPSFPEDVALFKFANALLLAAVGGLTFVFARRRLELPNGIAFLATLAGTATIPPLVLGTAIMSEPLFLTALLPLLLWSERLVQHDPHGRVDLGAILLLGASVGALSLIRTQGIALGAPVLIALWLGGRRRDALACAAAIIVVLSPWALWVHAHDAALPPLVRGAYGSYVGWFVTGLRANGWRLLGVAISDNTATLWMTIEGSLAPPGHGVLAPSIGGLYLLLAAAGAGRWWRQARVTTLFVACYLALVIVWPFSPLRFYWGIWPLLMLFAAVGLVELWHGTIVRRLAMGRPLLVAAAVVFAAAMLWFNAIGFANSWWSSNARFHARRVLPQLDWVSHLTTPSDIIGSDAEGAVYLYTGRRAVPITTFTAAEYARERSLAEESAVVAQQLSTYHPRYVLATSPRLAAAAQWLTRTKPPLLLTMDSIQNGVVFARP